MNQDVNVVSIITKNLDHFSKQGIFHFMKHTYLRKHLIGM